MTSSTRTKRKASTSSDATSKSKPKNPKSKGPVAAANRSVQIIDGTVKSTAKKSKAKGAKKKSKKQRFSARTADVHELYQLAVQSPDVDAEFLAKLFKRLRKRPARHLREDFCGTGYLAAEWLRRHKSNTVEGFDIDEPTVAWGLERNFEGIENLEERVELHIADVREPSRERPDVRTAPNFSWQIFTDRSELLEYFKAARADLADDGLYVIDIYGGPEAYEEMEEERKIPAGFTYVWDQAEYWPATGMYHCKIHFRFKDGSEMRNAFDYHWRLWNLPEVMDLLREAGFSTVDSYWEGTEDNGVDGNGVYRKSKKGENCPAWVTYIVAQP